METKVVDVAGTKAGKKTEMPLYQSQPAAGFPAPGDDQVEKALDINDLVVENPASTFFVRVSGDSMIGAGIFDNDVLVIDRSVEAVEGKIVVAAVYGELVVKRYTKVGDQPALVSENEAYQPILVNESEDVYLWGVVTGSVRVF